MTDLVGATLADRYRIGAVVGCGGMGVVHVARDAFRDRDVAIKLLHDDRRGDATAVRYLTAEGQLGRRIVHPHVVAVFDGGATAELGPYVVMELLRGRPLAAVVAELGPLPLARTIAIATQLLAALQAIHDASLVHGDIKLDNLLVEQLDGRDVVTLIDLGLLHCDGDGVSGVASGTPNYMAPEVIRGEGSTAAADIYAAGVVMYELLTGATPFGGGSTCEILSRHVDDDVVPPSLRCPERLIPVELEHAVLRALAKDPRDRHRSARDFARTLALAEPCEVPAFVGRPAPRFSTQSPTADWYVDPPQRFAVAGHREPAPEPVAERA